MKKSVHSGAVPSAGADSAELTPIQNRGSSELPSPDLAVILTSLQTMRNGDFSVRLPGSWTGLAGKIADTFNDIAAANQLWISRGIVQKYDGSIRFRSLRFATGNATCFSVFIPASTAPASVATSATATAD